MKNNEMNVGKIVGSVRVDNLDIYKGLAILLVVIGHVSMFGTGNPDQNLLFKSIQMFHMSMFFVISGMVFGLKPLVLAASDLPKVIARRAAQLLLPFLAWHLVSYAMIEPRPSMAEHMAKLFRSPDNGLWFLWVLFVFSCLADVAKVMSRFVPVWAVLLVCEAALFHLSIHYHVLGLGLIATHLPFFIGGIFSRQILSTVGRWKGATVIAASCAYPFMVIIWDRLNTPQPGIWMQQEFSLPMSTWLYSAYLGVGALYQALFALVGTIVFFVGAKAFTAEGGGSARLAVALSYIGQRTLAIYAIHFFFVRARSFDNQLLNGLVTCILAVGMSILISEYLLKPNRVASRLLLGK